MFNKILGHATPAITMSVYSHELQEGAEEVCEAMSRIVVEVRCSCGLRSSGTRRTPRFQAHQPHLPHAPAMAKCNRTVAVPMINPTRLRGVLTDQEVGATDGDGWWASLDSNQGPQSYQDYLPRLRRHHVPQRFGHGTPVRLLWIDSDAQAFSSEHRPLGTTPKPSTSYVRALRTHRWS